MNGVLVIDKPKGYTSFDVVAKVRKLTGEKKIGHTGTLDPLATGVLVVLLGNATRAQMFMQEHEKGYIAELLLGTITDTQDITGNVIKKIKSDISKEEFEKTIKDFIGEIYQVPPMYSAIKKNGKKLYELAREGKEVDREKRRIKIYNINLLEYSREKQTAIIEVLCSKGTYIRTLCEDIGNKLGCGGVMTQLRRTQTDGFSLEDSITLENLEDISKKGNVEEKLLNTEILFNNLETIKVTKPQAIRFTNGGGLMLSRIKDERNVRLLKCVKVCYENTFLGLGEIDNEKEEIRVLKIFNNYVDKSGGENGSIL